MVWPSIDGTRLHAAWAVGASRTSIRGPVTRIGEPWHVEGFPLWISVAPDGDRIAVTYLDRWVAEGAGTEDDVTDLAGDPLG